MNNFTEKLKKIIEDEGLTAQSSLKKLVFKDLACHMC